MYSRRRKRTKKYVYSGAILVLCLLVLGVAWPFSEEPKNSTATVENVSSENNAEEPYSEESSSNSYEAEQNIENNEMDENNASDENNETDETMNDGIIASNEAYYLVKRDGDRIAVYYCVGEQTIELEDTGIVYELLGPEDQKLFDNGIKLNSQEELGVLLQDFES